MLEKNNLFSFATSELSQDAFICWCLNWINYPNEELYPMAKDIFSNLLEEKEKNYFISEEELSQKKYWELNIAWSTISQYEFMRKIFPNGYIRSGRSIGGGVYTQYDILEKKIFPDTREENLPEDKRIYTVFWRIDSKDKIGSYISINFYTEHGKGDKKPRAREDEYVNYLRLTPYEC